MKSNLDVWSIQNYPEKLYTALNKIDKGLNIIYSNTLSRLLVGNHITYNINYNTIIYNNDSDILILIENNDITKDEIINYFEKNKKKYVEVTFYSFKNNFDNNKLPEIWYARDISILEDAINNSINKGNFNATFYPYAYVQLNIGFKNNIKDNIEIDGRLCKGIIKFKDKIILLINQKNNIDKFNRIKTVTAEKALYMFKKYNINTSISYDTMPNLYIENDEKKLSLKKAYKKY